MFNENNKISAFIQENQVRKRSLGRSERSKCPRCEGYGFIHASIDKHDRPSNTRCKKCIDCKVCESSGVTKGVIKCQKCSCKGFIHDPNAPKPHLISDFIKCFDCHFCTGFLL